MSEKTVPINIRDVPETVRANFKAYCAKRGLSMRGALIGFMRECHRRDERSLKTAHREFFREELEEGR